MRKLFAGDCHASGVYQLLDPTRFLERDFEPEVVKALTCLIPEYRCGVFAGAFVHEGERHVADLALIHQRNTHWFVVEVEMAGHSFEHHVLPQVRCFRYGDADPSCITSLVRAFDWLSREQAETLLKFIPRHVVVIGNVPDSEWTSKLDALDVQHLTVSIYGDRTGRSAYEIEGHLQVRAESLGFGQFSAIDNCLRITKACGLPVGRIPILDQFGNVGSWVVRDESGTLWMRKEHGPALIAHNAYVQVIRSYDGNVSIRPST